MASSGDQNREGPPPSDKTFTDLQEKVMASSGDQNREGPPPTDPSDPDYVCPCHIVWELCDRCMDAIDTTAMIEQIREDQNNREDQSQKRTTHPSEKTPERSSKKLKVEGGVLDAEDTTPETTPKNGAVLVSVTRINKNKYKYNFQYRATVTAAEDPATPSTSGTQKVEEFQEEIEEVVEENNEDNEEREENGINNEMSASDSEDTPIVEFETDEEEFDGKKWSHVLQLENSNDDNPIVVGGGDALVNEDEIEEDEPEYDEDGNEIVAGHQL